MAMTKEKKNLRLKIRHFAPDSMSVTKGNKQHFGGVVGEFQSKEDRGPDEIAWQAGSGPRAVGCQPLLYKTT